MAFDGSTISRAFVIEWILTIRSDSRGKESSFLEGRKEKKFPRIGELRKRDVQHFRGSTCNSFELKPISTHGRSYVSWFLRFQMRACVMQARLLDICLTCLLGQCILEGGVVPSRMRRRRL